MTDFKLTTPSFASLSAINDINILPINPLVEGMTLVYNSLTNTIQPSVPMNNLSTQTGPIDGLKSFNDDITFNSVLTIRSLANNDLINYHWPSGQVTTGSASSRNYTNRNTSSLLFNNLDFTFANEDAIVTHYIVQQMTTSKPLGAVLNTANFVLFFQFQNSTGTPQNFTLYVQSEIFR